MNKRSRPRIDRQVQDQRPQGAVPDHGKSRVSSDINSVAKAESKNEPIDREGVALEKESERLNHERAPVRIQGEDDYWIRWAYNHSRVKQALGIDDDDFCEGILQQLDKVLSIEDGTDNRRNFDFVLSVVNSSQPIDKFQAMLSIQMALCQLCLMRQSEILLRPINYELPCDVAVTLHRVSWDAGRMEPQRIKIADQPVRQAGERMVTRLMQTYVMQLEAFVGYRKASQQVSASTSAEAFPSNGTAAIRHKAHSNGKATS